MADAQAPEHAELSAEAVAHCALQVGRILLQNGGDTGQVQHAIKRLAEACGCEAHLLVTYEALLLTLVSQDSFRTKVGNRIPAMNVGMSALVSVYGILDGIGSGAIGLPEAQAAVNPSATATSARW
jgi:uncharacterized membrane protein YjjP (DUF1212 family)